MILSELRQFLFGKTVVVTGHSGFKGAWLTLWLASLGARVVGISLPPDQGPDSLFLTARIDDVCDSRWLDVRDSQALVELFRQLRPELVFHLAAQPLVHAAYRDPINTFSTNVMGTANVLEAAVQADATRALVCVTTDKVYDNREWHGPYRESDPLGGADPYSASKAAAELVAISYMRTLARAERPLRLATARGGNVVGGGDWADGRIIPDVVRAVRRGEALILRNPDATRPWQHVTELCLGYMLLAMRLDVGRPERGQDRESFVGAWNFGPDPINDMPVQILVTNMLQHMGRVELPVRVEPSALKEATYLRLDSSKARSVLGWHSLLTLEETMAWTASWYCGYIDNSTSALDLTTHQIRAYEQLIDSRLEI